MSYVHLPAWDEVSENEAFLRLAYRCTILIVLKSIVIFLFGPTSLTQHVTIILIFDEVFFSCSSKTNINFEVYN